jgi:hypothetical protein
MYWFHRSRTRIGHRVLQSRSESLAPDKLEMAHVIYLAHVRRQWSDLVSQGKNGNPGLKTSGRSQQMTRSLTWLS